MNNDWFFEKFALIADAPGAVERMRELVLSLAISGFLVEQSDDDGRADALLAEIQKERNQRSTKLQTTDIAMSSSDNEHFLRIPSHWCWTQLGNIAIRIQYGFTASADPSLSEIRMLRITDIQNNRVDWSLVPGCQIDKDEATKYLLSADDILIARTGGTIGKSFIVPDAPVKSIFASYLIRITPPRAILANYLKRFLESPFYWTQLRQMSAGTGQPNVNGQALGRLSIPLPPLAEQKRIVAKVDELMGLCDSLEAQQQERELRKSVLVRSSLSRFAEAPTPENLGYLFHKSYDIPPSELRKSILTLAVQGKLVPQDPNDEPASDLLHRLRSEKLEKIRKAMMRKPRSTERSFVDNADIASPTGWAWGCVADFGAPEDNAIVDGPFGSNLRLSDYDSMGGYPVITISNIDEGFDLQNLRKVSEAKFQELKRSAVRANDILVAKIGSSYGKVGLYPDYMPVGIIPANLLKITPHPSMNWKYLVITLRSSDFRSQLETIVQFTAQPAFGISNFKLLPIPIPPFAEQCRIVAKVDQLMALVDELERQQAASRENATKLLDAIVQEMTSSG